ncbi:hypothetical protein ACFOMH_00960 [Paracoccus mangrovi]|uniref:Uncharacterized protein n=1 Tax=Paracoccus mangrovi TaxID=1715645 RepID=A0ABV7QZG0_9RHOB
MNSTGRRVAAVPDMVNCARSRFGTHTLRFYAPAGRPAASQVLMPQSRISIKVQGKYCAMVAGRKCSDDFRVSDAPPQGHLAQHMQGSARHLVAARRRNCAAMHAQRAGTPSATGMPWRDEAKRFACMAAKADRPTTGVAFRKYLNNQI